MRTLVTLGLGALALYLLRDRLTGAKRLVSRRAAGTDPDLSYRQYVASTEAPQSAQHLGR